MNMISDGFSLNFFELYKIKIYQVRETLILFYKFYLLFYTTIFDAFLYRK